MHQCDYVVIGGGIVGLSVAWAILGRRQSARVVVLEKEDDWALHQTGRNSGVIHSGIYYKPGSLKATLCREGHRKLLEFCETYGVQHEVCGKVIVATMSTELSQLEKLYERGLANGLAVRRLSSTEVHEIEPNVACIAGVHVPSTGIVDYTQICRTLAELIQQRGGTLMLRSRAKKIEVRDHLAVVETESGTVAARWAVNCAGLHSDRVAKSAGARLDAQIVPFRGEYYELKPERRKLIRHLVYPVPDPEFPFLGVHFTRMIDGSVHAGPNAVLSLKREGYHRTSFDFRDFADTFAFSGFWRLAARHGKAGLEEVYRSISKRAFVRSLQRLVPEIQEDDLVPSAAGVRAQALRRDGSLVDDFMIVSTPCTIHVCNAPSPAATASLEIGRVIADQVPD